MEMDATYKIIIKHDVVHSCDTGCFV